jgi:hypothetical protein
MALSRCSADDVLFCAPQSCEAATRAKDFEAAFAQLVADVPCAPVRLRARLAALGRFLTFSAALSLSNPRAGSSARHETAPHGQGRQQPAAGACAAATWAAGAHVLHNLTFLAAQLNKPGSAPATSSATDDDASSSEAATRAAAAAAAAAAPPPSAAPAAPAAQDDGGAAGYDAVPGGAGGAPSAARRPLRHDKVRAQQASRV